MEYKKESMKRPESVLFLEYEEMQERPEECMRRLAEFLRQPFTREEEEEDPLTGKSTKPSERNCCSKLAFAVPRRMP